VSKQVSQGKIETTLNNKQYVGQTIGDINDRWGNTVVKIVIVDT
jgi:hypothetical protein